MRPTPSAQGGLFISFFFLFKSKGNLFRQPFVPPPHCGSVEAGGSRSFKKLKYPLTLILNGPVVELITCTRAGQVYIHHLRFHELLKPAYAGATFMT